MNELQAWTSHNCAQCARDEGFCDHYLLIEAKWVNEKPLDAPVRCLYREKGSVG